jgi:hypothetical protein
VSAKPRETYHLSAEAAEPAGCRRSTCPPKRRSRQDAGVPPVRRSGGAGKMPAFQRSRVSARARNTYLVSERGSSGLSGCPGRIRNSFSYPF